MSNPNSPYQPTPGYNPPAGTQAAQEQQRRDLEADRRRQEQEQAARDQLQEQNRVDRERRARDQQARRQQERRSNNQKQQRRPTPEAPPKPPAKSTKFSWLVFFIAVVGGYVFLSTYQEWTDWPLYLGSVGIGLITGVYWRAMLIFGGVIGLLYFFLWT